jgi:hypothetical protein
MIEFETINSISLDCPDIFEDEAKKIVEYIIQTQKTNHIPGEAIAAKYNGKTICFFSIERKVFPVVSISLLPLKTFFQCPTRKIIAGACYMFNKIFSTEINRIEAQVSENPKHQKFLEFFGFECEGVSKCFGPNKENFYAYSLVK